MKMSLMAPPKAPRTPTIQDLRVPLLRYVTGRVRSPEVAEDLVQDVLLKASQSVSTVQSPEALPGWLFQIARNRVADHFRAARDTTEFHEDVHSTENTPAAVEDQEESALRESLNHYVRSVVEGLPPLYREALLATEYAGVSQAEFARRKGLSASAVKSRVQRARALMRAEMERCCAWEADLYGQVLGITPRKCGGTEK